MSSMTATTPTPHAPTHNTNSLRHSHVTALARPCISPPKWKSLPTSEICYSCSVQCCWHGLKCYGEQIFRVTTRLYHQLQCKAFLWFPLALNPQEENGSIRSTWILTFIWHRATEVWPVPMHRRYLERARLFFFRQSQLITNFSCLGPHGGWNLGERSIVILLTYIQSKRKS